MIGWSSIKTRMKIMHSVTHRMLLLSAIFWVEAVASPFHLNSKYGNICWIKIALAVPIVSLYIGSVKAWILKSWLKARHSFAQTALKIFYVVLYNCILVRSVWGCVNLHIYTMDLSICTIHSGTPYNFSANWLYVVMAVVRV